jgi:BMFP domain-containing protein YqiC
MADRPKFFDDLAGVAGGAMSALAGVRDEAEALMRARIDEAIRHFDLAKREDVEAAKEMAANARAGQEAAEAKLADAMERFAALEKRIEALEARAQDTATQADRPAGNPTVGGGGPGMIA